MVIKEITASETIDIRHSVLRPGRPVETCYFKGDNHPDTFHLGAFIDGKLVSVASFYREKSPLLKQSRQYRLRGMATLPSYRNRRAATALIERGFEILRNQNISAIWCNARMAAKNLYLKAGFEILTEEFIIEGIGPHVVMAVQI